MALSQKEKFIFTWQIQNFSMCPQKFQEELHSAIFKARTLENSEWQLQLCPEGYKTENMVSCFLCCKSLGSTADNIQIGFSVSVFCDDARKKVAMEENSHIFIHSECYGFYHLISRDDIFGDKEAYLPNDTLTIKCSLWISDSADNTTDPSSSELKSELDHTASKDNARLYFQSEECTVMTRIIVQNKKISWPISSFNTIDFNKRLTRFVPSALTDVPSFFMTFYKSSADQTANIEIGIDENDLSETTFLKCKASVLCTPKAVDISSEDEHLFEPEVGDTWKFPFFINLNKLEEYKYFNSTCDTLHLLFEFSFSRLGYIFHTEKVALLQSGTFGNLSYPSEEFRDMYKTGEFSDVTIQAGDREFKVHKVILKAKSPVFGAMFDNDMKEKKTGIVDITDFDPDTVDGMLVSMYTNVIEDTSVENVLKLYSIADKYQVLPLKFRCTWILISNLSVSNVGQILTLADRHNDDYLRVYAESFVHTNSTEILKSPEWEDLMKINSLLAAQVMHKMLTN